MSRPYFKEGTILLSMSHLKLYGADVCPFVHRVRLVLAEKGLEHEYVAIDFRNKPTWYYDVLPTGKVPLLEHGLYRVWESAIVCEYLEDAFPQPALLSEQAGERATVRLWIEEGGQHLVAPFYKLLKAQTDEERAQGRDELCKGLEKIDHALRGNSWLVGDSLSLADLELYPWFERLPILEHYRDFRIPSELEALHLWIERLSQRASVFGIANSPEYYIEHYRSYAEP